MLFNYHTSKLNALVIVTYLFSLKVICMGDLRAISGDGQEFSSTMTAPSDGYFVGYLFASSGGSGYIKGVITRGGSTQFSTGISVQYSATVNVPYASYTYPAKHGDIFTYDRVTSGTVEGGVGFAPAG